MSLDAFQREIATMRALQSAIAQATDQQPSDWRWKVIDHRRELIVHLGDLSSAITAWQPPTASSGEAATLRRSVSALRAALAEHQAQWPVVSIDTNSAEYRESVRRVRKAYADLEANYAALVRSVSPSERNSL